MEAQATGNKLHPVLWVAAVAVILLSLAGVGAIFGVIPTAGSSSKQSEPIAAVPAQATAPAAAPAPVRKAAEPTVEHKPAPPKKVASKPAVPAAEPAQVAQVAAPPATQPAAPPAPPPAPAICVNCGTVDSLREYEVKGEGTGVGAVGGAVVGGLLGNQIGRGSGKTAATVVGAVGGGVAGHQVEKHVRSTKKYEMTVRFEDGSSRVFNYDSMPVWRIGDRVKLENGMIVSR